MLGGRRPRLQAHSFIHSLLHSLIAYLLSTYYVPSTWQGTGGAAGLSHTNKNKVPVPSSLQPCRETDDKHGNEPMRNIPAVSNAVTKMKQEDVVQSAWWGGTFPAGLGRL